MSAEHGLVLHGGRMKAAVKYGARPDGPMADDPLLSHLRAVGDDIDRAILEAVLGRDPVATGMAKLANGDEACVHDADVLDLVTSMWGGLDAEVVIRLAFYRDDFSIEDADHWGVAWKSGVILVQPPAGHGIVLRTDGTATVYMDMPATICAAAAGRTLNDLLETDVMPASRLIAHATSADGQTDVAFA